MILVVVTGSGEEHGIVRVIRELWQHFETHSIQLVTPNKH